MSRGSFELNPDTAPADAAGFSSAVVKFGVPFATKPTVSLLFPRHVAPEIKHVDEWGWEPPKDAVRCFGTIAVRKVTEEGFEAFASKDVVQSGVPIEYVAFDC